MDIPVKAAEMRMDGLAVSDGVVLARIYVIERDRGDALPVYQIPADTVEAERERLSSALAAAAHELDDLVTRVGERIGPAQAEIFVAQKMMVEDPVLRDQMDAIINNEHLNAEAAVDKVLDGYEAILKEVDDDYMSERASDIGEIRRRLIDTLLEERGESSGPRTVFAMEEPRIIVAEELSPAETVTLDPQYTVGFLTEKGGAASHAAILARALGIPAVSGVPRVHKILSHGQQVLLNGSTGEVILWPSSETLKLHPAARRGAQKKLQAVPPIDGFRVMANISLSTEMDAVRESEAEGVGLYRTEFEFLAAGRILTEDEQYERYARVLEALDGKALHVRLLDLGADKDAPFLGLSKEINPCLGFRGARLLQGKPEWLLPQARALARASQHGEIHVIYPMIVDTMQFLRLRALVEQEIAGIEGASLRHGIMFEVPSACLMAKELFEYAEFGSIGSNDLIQYLFAVDRGNDLVAADYTPDRPVFWDLIGRIVHAANAASRPLSLCGEISGRPEYVEKLHELGMRCVSVSPRGVALTRTAVRRLMTSAAAT